MNDKTKYGSIKLYTSIAEFEDILNFTYGHVLVKEPRVNKNNGKTQVYSIWDKIEIEYNIDEHLVIIYKLPPPSPPLEAEAEIKNEVENDNDKMIDLVIESTILCILSMDGGANISNERDDDDDEDRLDLNIDPIISLFKEQFGDSFSSMEGVPNNGIITLDRINAQVDFTKLKVIKCNSNPLRGRIESLLSVGRDLTQSLC